MNNQRRIILCLVFTLLFLTPVLAYGQDDEPDEPQDGKADIAGIAAPGKKALLIINGSRLTRVTFSVKNGDSDWIDFSLDPHKDVVFLNTTNIRIATENSKTVEYRLAYANRYQIYWNESENCWDVTRLVPK